MAYRPTSRALKTISALRVDLTPDEISQMRDENFAVLEQLAEKEFNGRDFIIRDLMPSDFPGITTEEYTETSSTDNTWTDTTAGNGGAIADDLIIMIEGLSLYDQQSTTGRTPPVSAFRIDVGAARRAIFSVYPLFRGGNVAQSGTAAGGVQNVPTGYLMTPIIATKTKTLLIQEYNITASAVYVAAWFGLAAEISGASIQA